MLKRTATPLAKDRPLLRNHSNHPKPNPKQPLPVRQPLARHPSNSKLPLPPNNPESIETYLRRQDSSRACKIKSAGISEEMRKLAVEWVVEISHRSSLKRETVFMGVALLDQMLAKWKEVTVQNLQLVATCALFIACKYEEIHPENMGKFLEYSLNSYSKQDLLLMEERLLAVVQFRLTFPTRYTFYGLLRESYAHEPHRNNKKLHALVGFLLEVSLLALWEDVSENDIAEAALFLAGKILKLGSGWASDSVMETAYKLMGLWRENERGVLAYIYDNEKYLFVGGLRIIY